MNPFEDVPPPSPFKARASYKQAIPDGPAKQSALKALTGYSTSALQTGLHVLDTPGAIVRGGLGSLIGAKASDGDRVSGRDLLDKVGLTRRGDTGLGAKALGLGAEIFTDPLTYFTGGSHHALTGSGKALKAIGATKKWAGREMIEGFHGTTSALKSAGHNQGYIDHLVDAGKRIATPEMESAVLSKTGKALQANEPLGALGGFGLPFRAPTKLIGTGKTAQAIAGGLDAAGHYARFGNPLGRTIGGLFDRTVGEGVGKASQEAMSKYGTEAEEVERATGRHTADNIMQQVDQGIKGGAKEEELLRDSTRYAEGVRAHHQAAPWAGNASEVGRIIHDAEAAQLRASQVAGMPLRDAADPFRRYAPRQGVDINAAKELAAGRLTSKSQLAPQVFDRNLIPVATGANFHIDEAYRGIPGGTEQLNDLATEFAGSKLNPDVAARTLKKRLWLEAMSNGHTSTRDLGRQLDAKAAELAQKLPGLPAEHNTHGIGLYSSNVTQNAARSAEQHARMMKSQAATYGFIGDNARPRSAMPSDSVPVSRLLDDLGFKHNLLGDASQNTFAEGARVQAYRALAKQGAGQVDPFLQAPGGVLKKAVDQYAVTRAHYDELMKSHGKWSTPEVLAGTQGLFRNLTSTFKNAVYPIWLPSHVRNSTSALSNNLGTGANFGDHFGKGGAGSVIRETATADDIRKYAGSMIPPGATDEEARNIIRHNGFVHGKIGDGHAGQADLDNAVAARLTSTTPGRITPDPFGTGRTGGGNFVQDTLGMLGGAAKDQARGMLKNPFQSPVNPAGGLRSPIKNPFQSGGPASMEGVWGATGDNPALKAGRMAGSNIEDFFRMAKYISGLRKGQTSEVAGQAVRDLHFDYDNLTKFEKNVMRQAVPFYTYMRKNLPLQMDYLKHTPGIPITQMRVMNAGRGKNDYVPDYLGGTAAIPIGKQEGDNQRYISGFGSPLEEALSRFKFKDGAPDVSGTAMNFLSNTNPFVKAPIEQMLNLQFSSGRKLSDLRASGAAKGIGSLWGDDNPQVLSQFMSNTPAARFFSTFDKAVDDRKPLWARGLNLGTGVKITDVDVARTRAAEQAEARNEIMSQMPHLSSNLSFFPRPGQEANMTEEEINWLRLLKTMQQDGREATAERKKRTLNIGIPR